MNKLLIFILVLVIIGLGGFIVYQNMNKVSQGTPQTVTSPTPAAESTSPIFGYLSTWLPGATWSAPEKSTLDSPYGNLTGMEVNGDIKGEQASIKRNFEDQTVMANLGFTEDINFAADGPGASNWGYSKTENGKKQVVVFRYSTNAIFGPESTAPPFIHVSVFVSDPFTPTPTP